MPLADSPWLGTQLDYMLGCSEVARSLSRPHVVRIKETADNVY